MRPLPLAIATRCLNQPLKPALVLAAQFGASGVQLDCRNELKADELSATGRRELLHRLEEMRLSIASLDFPLRRGLFDPDRLDARVVALKQAMEFASQLRCRVVTARLGKLPDGEGKTDLPLTVLSDLAGVGNHVGVTLAVGPGGESPEPWLELLRQVSAGPLGVNFDPASVVSAGRSPIDVMTEWGPLMNHVMVRDAIRDGGGDSTEVPVGRGEVEWQEVLAIGYELNYRGWFCVDRTQGNDKAGDAGRAVQYLRSLELG
ncbi:MAG TPA: sugar phosphate isomerase/epimerase family protein [Planctomycetaceae bacterium]|jgi:sugar phosphate isomerase/epimerase|nr:sugar phosphate isomerase/epimerase family protein [Planctomycetaceae bacterium]